MYYDADQCPGARSTDGTYSVSRGGRIPGAGSSRDLVKDALDATNAISNTIPGFSWANYDQNGDGISTACGSSTPGTAKRRAPPCSIAPITAKQPSGRIPHPSRGYVVDPVNNIEAGAYIIMPENGGIGVFAHEYGHNLGAMDLYAYDQGETSAGFWTSMADDWTGYPIGFEPPAPDPDAPGLVGLVEPPGRHRHHQGLRGHHWTGQSLPRRTRIWYAACGSTCLIEKCH